MMPARMYDLTAMKAPIEQPVICRDLVSAQDFSPEETKSLFELSHIIKHRPADFRGALAGKQMVLFFEKPSLRTRLTFEAGMASLGGTSLFMDQTSSLLGEREPVCDIARNVERWVDAVVLRTFSHKTIVEMALNAYPETAAFTVLDLGVGSGAILLSILAERPAARGLGTDVSEEALAVARDNAANLDLNGRAAFLRTGWADGLADESFDLVVSNPPYIRTAELAGLDPEVKDHEPHLALDGGPDGLKAYRELAPEILRVLKPDGMFLVEIGWDQAQEVPELFKAAGAWDVAVVKDLSARDRVVAGRKKALGKDEASR